jgi:protein gp37
MLDLRAPHLLAIEAKVRVVSAEPLLEALDLGRYLPDLGWVIVGGESGPRARPSNPDWFRSLRAQCSAAGVPLFFKQWGEHGQDMRKVGRRIAGAMLDGRAHRDAPA